TCPPASKRPPATSTSSSPNPAATPELRLAALVCRARVHRARYARDGDPEALEQAADAYGRARRLIPRDGEAYGELLPEWGEALLERARAAGGRRFASAAVRVLRDSRAAVPQSDGRSAHRLVRLAEGLRLRHGYEGDVVDLREAEYLLELAVRQSRSPLEQARAWREHGDVQQEIHAHTRALDHLDRAADCLPAGLAGGPGRRPGRAARGGRRAGRPGAGAAGRGAGAVWPGPGPRSTPTARPWSCGGGSARRPRTGGRRSAPASAPWRPGCDTPRGTGP
ncbi:hypothetical protein V3664_33645, partial [Streptomyces sp. CS62]